MAMDEKRFPELIGELYRVAGQLEAMFPGRPFTPDGHMVGSLAECYAEYYYGIKLYTPVGKGHEGRVHELHVEVKATQGDKVTLRGGPERLLVLRMFKDGSFEEVYNGPGAPVWALAGHTRGGSGQFQVSLKQLQKLMESVPVEQRMGRVRK